MKRSPTLLIVGHDADLDALLPALAERGLHSTRHDPQAPPREVV